jgi:hypothetical protein
MLQRALLTTSNETTAKECAIKRMKILIFVKPIKLVTPTPKDLLSDACVRIYVERGPKVVLSKDIQLIGDNDCLSAEINDCLVMSSSLKQNSAGGFQVRYLSFHDFLSLN